MLSSKTETIVEALKKQAPPVSLAPQAIRDPELAHAIASLDTRSLFSVPVAEPAFAQAFLSGLYLLNDDLWESHRLAMSDSAPEVARATLDYWHGIMHRREPDYPNSKYWFRRVGSHELFPQVLSAAQATLASTGPTVVDAVRSWKVWNPFAVVDMVEHLASRSGADVEVLQTIQAHEMLLLLDYSARRATGRR
ncbi:hypothetical protein FJZ36_09880 [Candidatus Poribacteria bacterium]|nr:hypothetical protein [Candidatus Poribacteria bacterium]